jgi:hypothetical protein
MDTYSSSYEDAGLFAVIMAAYVAFLIYFIIVRVIKIIGMWRVFEKAGKPGWAAIVPIYCTLIKIEIVGKPTIWILWHFLPCVNIVFSIWLTNLISKSYGKSEGFTIGMIFLPWIFWPILGFGDSKYLGPSASEAQGFNNGFNPNNPFNQPPTPPQA